MKYYELHEQAYKQLKQKGNDSWDQFLGQAEDFDNFCLRDFVSFAIAKFKPSSKNPRALEIGCGTGPVSCFLAQNGYKAEGIDVSKTAIEVAKKQAQTRNLNVEFYQKDLCGDELGNETYDLVVDGHCMHCIVTKFDRQKAYSNIFNSLKPGGMFWMDTMLGHEQCSFKNQIWDEDGVLWTKIGANVNFEQVKEIDGEKILAHRRVYRHSDALIQELNEVGFEILWQNITDINEQNHPVSFQAVCIRR